MRFGSMERLVFLVIILVTSSVYSQNLVLNPSFEEFFDCPKGISFFHRNVKNWSIPNNGTTDYFNSCSDLVGIKNFIGEQEPHSGNGYCGIYVYDRGNYREYIQGRLENLLERDKTYEISFYVSLADKSSHAVDTFQLVFFQNNLTTYSTDYIDLKEFSENSRLINSVSFNTGEFIENKSDWIKLTAQYKAIGFENYFIIGNFNNNSTQTRTKVSSQKGKSSSYYYIDDVSIVSQNKEDYKEIKSDQHINNTTLELDKLYAFQNVLFDFDKSQLLDDSKEEIQKLSIYLKENEGFDIEIYGHTDNIGTSERNEELSLERAKEVAYYLIELGLNAERIKWFGFGSSKSISTNETEEGRATNRRVEFKLFKKE